MLRRGMRVGIFSGIGGLDLPFSCTYSCGDPIGTMAPRAPDVRLLLEGGEVLVASPPCQPFSVSGHKLGYGDGRSLLHEVLRLLPGFEWLVMEEVNSFLKFLPPFAEAVEALGYAWAYRIVDAHAWVPQRRRRLLFTASRHGDPRGLFHGSTSRTTRSDWLGFYWSRGVSGVGLTLDGVPPLLRGSGGPTPPAALTPWGVELPTLACRYRLMGYPHPLPGSPKHQHQLLANSVPLPMGEWYARTFDRGWDGPTKKFSWSSHASFSYGGRASVDLSPFPEDVSPSLPAIWEGVPISPAQAKGFLTRYARGKLTLPARLLEAL